MGEDEEVDHQIGDLKLVLVDEGKLNYAEVFVVLPCLQVEMSLHK